MDTQKIFTVAAERLKDGVAHTPSVPARPGKPVASIDKYGRAEAEIINLLNHAKMRGDIQDYLIRDLKPSEVVPQGMFIFINGAKHAERYAGQEKTPYDFSIFFCHNEYDEIKIVVLHDKRDQSKVLDDACQAKMGEDNPFISITTLNHIDTPRGVKALENIAGALMHSRSVFEQIAKGYLRPTPQLTI